MISFRHRGSFKNSDKFFSNLRHMAVVNILEEAGRYGVKILSESTPKDTGKTANSWNYEITNDGEYYKITWTNSNIVNGVNVALLLQYGHGTGNGGYVEGIDFINPAIATIFKDLLQKTIKEVSIL